jgi:WhiB family redox-sensing transcriptional regulator
MITETLQLLETHDQPWMRDALCATDPNPDFWFPDPEDTAEIRQLKTAEAIRVCKHCPVRGQCLEWAFATGDEWAILGATTKGQRTRTRRRLQRAKAMKKEGR